MALLACLVIVATFSFSATGSACHSDPITLCQLEEEATRRPDFVTPFFPSFFISVCFVSRSLELFFWVYIDSFFLSFFLFLRYWFWSVPFPQGFIGLPSSRVPFPPRPTLLRCRRRVTFPRE